MTYDNFKLVWESLPDVISTLKRVYIGNGMAKYQEDLKSAVAHPVLVVQDPLVTFNAGDSKTWTCKLIVADVYEEGHTARDGAYDRAYAIVEAIVYLLQQPAGMGFGHSVFAQSFSSRPVIVGINEAAGWELSFVLEDHTEVCAPGYSAEFTPTVTPLPLYKSDEEAKTVGGLAVGKYYLLSDDNIYYMAGGIPKVIQE